MFKPYLPVQHAFQKEGKQIFVVGGCVRDYLLGVTPKDVDFTTDAHPDEIKTILLGLGANVIDKLGGNYGTVHAIFDGNDIEITTFRIDRDYPAGDRRPVVEFSDRLSDDLVRRDFTINAIAATINEHGGLRIEAENQTCADGWRDLKNGIIRSPQNPKKLMADDPLRILRMYRFAFRFGFKVDMELGQAVKEHACHLKFISRERISDELKKIAGGSNPHLAFRMMMEDGVLQQIIPFIGEQLGYDQKTRWHHLPLWEHTLLVVRNASSMGGNYKTVLAALFHDIAKPFSFQIKDDGSQSYKMHDLVGAEKTAEILTNLKFSSQEVKDISFMVEKHMAFKHDSWDKRKTRRFLNTMGDLWEQQIILLRADNFSINPLYVNDAPYEQLISIIPTVDIQEVQHIKLPINGNRVMELLGLKPGKELGEVMRLLKDRVIDGDIENVAEAEDYVKKFPILRR